MKWTDAIQAAVALVAAGALAFVRAWVKTNLTPERVAHVTDIARLAVRAAEQLGVGNGATSDDKAEYAARVVADGARRLGLKLTDDEAVAFVHAALQEMLNLQKPSAFLPGSAQPA